MLNTKIEDISSDVDIKQGYTVLRQGAFNDIRTILYTAPYDCIIDAFAAVNDGLKYFTFTGVDTAPNIGARAINAHFKLAAGGKIDLWTQAETAKVVNLYYSIKATKV